MSAVATTLYGYTAETAGMRGFSLSLLEELVRRIDIPVIVEGHINEPADVRRALDMGAHAVLVGSAITRPAEHYGALRRCDSKLTYSIGVVGTRIRAR